MADNSISCQHREVSRDTSTLEGSYVLRESVNSESVQLRDAGRNSGLSQHPKVSL